MRTLNGNILAVPFEEKGVMVSQNASGIKFVGNYDHLVKTRVLADGPEGIKAGDVIHVRGTSTKTDWARGIFQFGETKAILVPVTAIVGVNIETMP